MKLRVLFLRKEYIYSITLIIIILALLSPFLFNRNSSETFSINNDKKLIEADITGDGKKDILFIKTDNKNKYFIEANIGNKSLPVEPDKKLNTLGYLDSSNPLNLMLVDISRDKTPELFVQSQLNNMPIQHIFLWNLGRFQDIFCSSNNVFGFIDCNNNKTPKILSGKLLDNKIELSSYILIGDKLQYFSNNYTSSFMGRDAIVTLIKYIEGLPTSEPDKPKDIFYPGLSGSDIAVIGRLAGENNTYKFENMSFKDTRWNKNGEFTEVKWTINFKGTSNINTEISKNYCIVVTMKPYDENESSEAAYPFRISSISLTQK